MSRSATSQRAKETIFLRELARHGVVGPAAKKAGVDRRTAYRWREDDAEFAEKWAEAVENATDHLEAEAYRRAADGTLRPVFYQGQKCGAVREFSDALVALILKARRPAVYRERVDVDHSGIPTGDATVVAAAAAALLERLREVRPDAEGDAAPDA